MSTVTHAWVVDAGESRPRCKSCGCRADNVAACKPCPAILDAAPRVLPSPNRRTFLLGALAAGVASILPKIGLASALPRFDACLDPTPRVPLTEVLGMIAKIEQEIVYPDGSTMCRCSFLPIKVPAPGGFGMWTKRELAVVSGNSALGQVTTRLSWEKRVAKVELPAGEK